MSVWLELGLGVALGLLLVDFGLVLVNLISILTFVTKFKCPKCGATWTPHTCAAWHRG